MIVANTTNSTGPSRRPLRRLLAALAAASALVGLALTGPASALAAPAPILDVSSSHYPPSVAAGSYAKYTLVVSNVGDAPTSGNVTLAFTLPVGLKVTAVTDEVKEEFNGAFSTWNCSIAGGGQSVSCTGPEFFGGLPIEPGKEACEEAFGGFIPSCRIFVTVKADTGASPGSVTPTIKVSGGGAADFDGSDPIDIGLAGFKIRSFDGAVFKQNGDPATQAGSHPHTATTTFFANTVLDPNGNEYSTEDIKDVTVKLPPGLIGNPQAYPKCTQLQALTHDCPPESQVATVNVWFDGATGGTPGHPLPTKTAVYNLQTPKGIPALFTFNIAGTLVQVYPKLRTGEDYGITVLAKNAPQTVSFEGVTFTFWGVPADPSHDADRACDGNSFGCSSEASPEPFLSLPTSCVGEGGVPGGAVRTFVDVTSWEGGEDSASFLSHAPGEPLNTIGTDGCNAVDFSPTLQARPTTTVADAPSGLDVDLHIPRKNEDPEGTAEAHLRDTMITLPEGLVVNPSGANGLDGCSLAQFGFTGIEEGTIHTTEAPATCPDASKLGSVTVDTPLLDHPVPGAVYIADPYDNPFNSLLALYIALNDPQSGTVVKLAGKVSSDPNTGRLSATVTNNPQLPFEDFQLHFFGGAGGSLRTPATCGSYTTTSALTPWTAPDSGPPAAPSDTWSITQAPGGGGCAGSAGALPNSPSFDAGTVSPIAGAYSPFVVHLRRNDGSQNFSALNISPPQGLIGKLAGTTQCSEAALAAAASKSGAQEKASPSCPASSEVGSVIAGAGAGPAPYYASGKAYLTGPYKGAPLSVAIVTPATAGPFDLGTIVVRTALYVDSKTAQLNAVSDPIPSILQGIPLDVRTVDVSLDRPEFTFNPTSCDPMAVNGQVTSTLGQVAPLSSRFQVGECGRLGFKPQMSLSLKGGTTRGKHPALTAVLTPRPGDANIASLSVALPKSEFLDQAHIGTVCTRVQFAADECPAASIYGEATVFTPLLDEPLTGHVYLRSSDNLLPDLVPDLRGPASLPVRVESAGRTDSIKGGIRNTFDFVPDAPFTKLVVQLQGGKKGLLQNSRNICSKPYKATVEYGAHNGKTLTQRPPLKNSKCGKAKRRKAAKKSKRPAAQRAMR